MAQTFQAGAKTSQRLRVPRQRDGYGHCPAKVERLERLLLCLPGMRLGILCHDAPQIVAELRNRHIIANVDAGQTLRQLGTVYAGKHPLCKIVRKAFRQEMMPPQALKCVIKDGSIAGVLQASLQLFDRIGLLILNLGEIRSSYKLERLGGSVHPTSSANRSRKTRTSA